MVAHLINLIKLEWNGVKKKKKKRDYLSPLLQTLQPLLRHSRLLSFLCPLHLGRIDR